MKEIEEGRILIYSGGSVDESAAAGVVCLIHRNLKNAKQQLTRWLESILRVQLNDKNLGRNDKWR